MNHRLDVHSTELYPRPLADVGAVGGMRRVDPHIRTGRRYQRDRIAFSLELEMDRVHAGVSNTKIRVANGTNCNRPRMFREERKHASSALAAQLEPQWLGCGVGE